MLSGITSKLRTSPPRALTSATPGTVRSSAPHLGDDTDAVLQAMGLSAHDIATLRNKGIIA